MYLLTIVNISTGDLDATNPNWTGCKECKTFDPSRKAATFDPLTWALLQIFQKCSDVVQNLFKLHYSNTHYTMQQCTL